MKSQNLTNREFLIDLRKTATELAETSELDITWKRAFENLADAANCIDAMVARTTVELKNSNEDYENPLLAPANYPLDVLLNELKRGRPAASQHLIEKWVKELAD